MITITEEIIINADVQKVWSFLSDFEISLNINSFHQEIIIPNEGYWIGEDYPQTLYKCLPHRCKGGG